MHKGSLVISGFYLMRAIHLGIEDTLHVWRLTIVVANVFGTLDHLYRTASFANAICTSECNQPDNRVVIVVICRDVLASDFCFII